MNPLASPFTDEDFEQLAAWLERRRAGITDIVELEGFLTPIVIGPNTLSPNAWLPKVWGGKAPKFKDLEEMNHFIALVMGLYNDLVLIFDQAPAEFRPTFYESKVRGRRVQIVDEWCVGFLKGMRIDRAGWTPLKRERPELLKPIELFGSLAGWRELAAGGEEKMHRRWSPKITPAVRSIHAYWVPHRIAQERQLRGDSLH
ncbi:MAG: UPF0149 family protein [Steroidobacteraceae bacterium]